MIRPNLKKMYLISEEKFKALTTNPLRENTSNIDIQSAPNSKTLLNNDSKSHTQNLDNPQLQPVSTNTNVQNDIHNKCSCNENDHQSGNKRTSDKSIQTDAAPVTPFRKIFTRKYKFKQGKSMRQNLNFKNKRKRFEFDLDQNYMLPPSKRTKYITNNKNNSHQKMNWLKLR